MERKIATNPPVLTVDRHKNLSQKELINEYVLKGKPVILTEAALPWVAMKKWTPDFFKTKYSHIEKTVNGRKIKMADQIDLLFNSTAENPAPYPYNFNMENIFPELVQDTLPRLVYGKTDRILNSMMPKALIQRTQVHELFFGGCGGVFPLHFDELFMHTQITQIYGRKEFYMFPPDQERFLYPEENNFKSSKIKNIFTVDLEKFPLFKECTPVVEMLNQGETLFFPNRWWHTTLMPGPSITYGSSHLNQFNWNLFLDDYYRFFKKSTPLKSALLYSYGKVLGKAMDVREALM
ncbi:MAG: cupin-like domain-containing protein [Bacteroidetes bacterium]|nr:cupin-like domain-containing protein [Bacteroidota bacterium]